MAASLKYLAYVPATYQIGRCPIGYTDMVGGGWGGAPLIGLPSVWIFISGDGIEYDTILILPFLSILPYLRP